jgi:hypothetical protein
MGKGKDSGSVGWVMHEYTIVAPPCLPGARQNLPHCLQRPQAEAHARAGWARSLPE